jgi:sugar-specific transcriptional regulator TrmB
MVVAKMKTEFLQSMGLTNYEIKAYISLHSGGVMTAKKVSQKSEVPYGKIYDVLYSLEKRRIIITQDSRPKKFKVVEPKKAIKNLIDDREEKLRNLIELAPMIEDELTKSYSKTDNSMFWTLEIYDEQISRFRGKVYSEAKREILLNIKPSKNEMDYLKKLNPVNEEIFQVQNLLERDVRIKMLISGVDNVKKLNHLPLKRFIDKLPSNKNFEIRFTQVFSKSFVIVDDEKVIVEIENPIEPETPLARLYLWKRNLAIELKKKFEIMWNQSRQSPYNGKHIT